MLTTIEAQNWTPRHLAYFHVPEIDGGGMAKIQSIDIKWRIRAGRVLYGGSPRTKLYLGGERELEKEASRLNRERSKRLA